MKGSTNERWSRLRRRRICVGRGCPPTTNRGRQCGLRLHAPDGPICRVSAIEKLSLRGGKEMLIYCYYVRINRSYRLYSINTAKSPEGNDISCQLISDFVCEFRGMKRNGAENCIFFQVIRRITNKCSRCGQSDAWKEIFRSGKGGKGVLPCAGLQCHEKPRTTVSMF